MTDYPTLLVLLAPVAAMIATGTLARWRGWLVPAAEDSLLKLVVNVLTPCLVFSSVLGNQALRQADNVIVPPLVGFGTMCAGFFIGFYGGQLLRLRRGTGLRTFAFAVGIYNYGYIPIPLVQQLFGTETLGVLFVHNIGCELAVWSAGVVMLAGTSLQTGWRRAINAPTVAIIGAILVNAVGWGDAVPAPVMKAFAALGACAVPLGLVVIGGTLYEYFGNPRALFDARVSSAAVLLRLGLLPLMFLLAARMLPLSVEVKQIMIVQAAMPAGVSPLVIARHYGGQPLTAAQVIIGTTIAGLLVIPLWIRFGLWWVGG